MLITRKIIFLIIFGNARGYK